MLAFRIDEKRTRDRIIAAGDIVEARLHAIHHRALQTVLVLLQEGITEHAKGGRGLGKRLDDGVVIFAGIDPALVLAQGVRNGLEPVAVGLFHFGQTGITGRALGHAQFDEGVARAGRRRRAINLDRFIGEGRVDFRPVRIGIVLHGAVIVGGRNLLGQRREKLLGRDVHRGGGFHVGNDDAVITDRNFHHGTDAVFLAHLELAGLDAAGGVGEVRLAGADAGAEQLHAAARARGLNNRGRERRFGAELFGDRRGERIDRGRADDLNRLARSHAGRLADRFGLTGGFGRVRAGGFGAGVRGGSGFRTASRQRGGANRGNEEDTVVRHLDYLLMQQTLGEGEIWGTATAAM